MNAFGGNIVRSINLDDQGKFQFASDAYNYFCYRTAEEESVWFNGMKSFCLYLLSSDASSMIYLETGESVCVGDAVQFENAAASLHVRGGGATFLVAGTAAAHFMDRIVKIVRAERMKFVSKPWGSELWVTGEHPGYCLKKININKGTRTSLQYHRMKRETNVLLHGQAKLYFKKDEDVPNDSVLSQNLGAALLSPVSLVDVFPNTLHRLEAVTDIVLCEVSTPHLDDVVRVSDDANRKDGRVESEHRPLQKSKVCILAAGRGTRMGVYSEIINKALLPVDRKAVISHIIDKFPKDADFVIGLGFLADQVRAYLEIAHPKTNFTFVNVENFAGPGSGPGLSLQRCSSYLQAPFYFVSCDTLWEEEIDPKLADDWFAAAAVPATESDQYCNLEIRDGRVTALRDKECVEGSQFSAFVGLCHIQNFEKFWQGMSEEGLIKGESQISKGITALINELRPIASKVTWSDVGTIEKYKHVASRHESFDFSKVNEFLYIVGEKVIKMFVDPSVTEKRVQKARLSPEVFPAVIDHRGQFYSYAMKPGKTLYEDINAEKFSALLSFLDEKLWKPKEVSRAKMREACRRFYYEKTMQRLANYHEKYDQIDASSVVNGVRIGTTASLLEHVPWSLVFDGEPAFVHGDLQFDNIIFHAGCREFTLLDWRQDFGGHVEFGDLYYDLAKLYGGILLNYSRIKENDFRYYEKAGEIRYELPRTDTGYVRKLEEFIRARNFNLHKVRILVGLIYLNMSPLHHFPFDKMLYSLSRLTLFNELGVKSSA